MRKPDIFVVGAPKCGTTAMDQYLSAHPEIHMCPVKEVHYFGRDLGFTMARPSLDRYLSLFNGAGAEQRVGESSVWYLYSKTAAEEIRAFSPEARIFIMLRNPVDMMCSLHSEFLFNGNEDIEDFEQALEAEPDRKNGKRLPQTVTLPAGLMYRETARYSEQVLRYFKVFPQDHVKVVLFDDFVRSTADVYRQALEWLGVDAGFRPAFGIVNPNKRVASKALRDVLVKPQGFPRVLAKALVPKHLREGVVRALWKLNSKPSPRAAMSPRLRASLTEEFKGEVRRLGEILSRDLTHWSAVREGEVEVRR